MGDIPDPEVIETITDRRKLSAPPAFLGRLTHLLQQIWQQVNFMKIGLFIISLFLFILAITLMKDGARDLGPVVRDRFKVDSPASGLGFGWLFAYIIMSGSPVAAAALTFFDGGAIDKLGAFAMITGSRLGGSFIVLFIGFIYVLRGRNRATSLSMGLLSLTVTGTTYLVGLVIGVLLLHAGTLDGLQLRSGAVLNSITDRIFDPLAALFTAMMPNWGLFLIGLAIIMASFSLFDRCLPQMAIKESQVGAIARLVYRPWVMFMLGAVVTLFSMSVSISLSILVPLGDRGFVRRENVIPYIMGANVTTFIDTLLAAVLLDNPEAFTIVLASMVSVTIVSFMVLLIGYGHYERAMLIFVNGLTTRRRYLALFMVTILVVPILLIFF